MTEINLTGEPIFVDVANDPQFPITYAQLLNSDDTDTTVAKPSTTVTNDAVPATNEEPQKQTKTNDQIQAINACIKIEKRRLKCTECKHYTCETEEKMLRHVRKQHRGENPFQCYMCDYSTYNKAVFEEHVRVHQGIKPFKCSHCKYRSASKKNTKKHELIHRADNPLRCPDCEFIAKNSQSLRCHKNKLHGVKKKTSDSKKYECDLCKREFSDWNKQNKHYQQMKKCTKCAFVTCSKMCYDSHLQFEHGILIQKTPKSKIFTCSHCPWSSNSKPRILLHLIHHPNQIVNEDVIDITVLRNCGIMR